MVGVGVLDGQCAVELGGVDDHVGVGELAELEQLGVGEGGLRGPAAADDDDLAMRLCASTSRAWSAVSVGGELGTGEHEHAGDVERDVAVADHDGALGGEQVDLEVGVVGVAVVPADELGGGVRAGEVFAGDAEGTVDGRAGGVDDRVVVGEQVLARDVHAEVDVAEEAEARVGGGLLVDAGDGLDLGMVGGDARADQAPGRGQALEHVDLELSRAVLQQVPGGVEAGGSRADHGDADGGVVGHWGWEAGTVLRGMGRMGAARLERATPSV